MSRFGQTLVETFTPTQVCRQLPLVVLLCGIAAVLLECCGAKCDKLRRGCCRTLTKWFFSTRLETRTKESTSIASVRVANLYAE